MWGDSKQGANLLRSVLQKALSTTQHDEQALTLHFSAIFTRWRGRGNCFWGPAKIARACVWAGDRGSIRGAMKRWASKGAKAATPRNTAQTAKLFGMYEILHLGNVFRRKVGKANISGADVSLTILPKRQATLSWLVGPQASSAPPFPSERSPRVTGSSSRPRPQPARNAGKLGWSAALGAPRLCLRTLPRLAVCLPPPGPPHLRHPRRLVFAPPLSS